MRAEIVEPTGVVGCGRSRLPRAGPVEPDGRAVRAEEKKTVEHVAAWPDSRPRAAGPYSTVSCPVRSALKAARVCQTVKTPSRKFGGDGVPDGDLEWRHGDRLLDEGAGVGGPGSDPGYPK